MGTLAGIDGFKRGEGRRGSEGGVGEASGFIFSDFGRSIPLHDSINEP